MTVGARVVRPGRSVELVEAHLDAGGRTAMTARAGFPPGKVDPPPIPAESMCWPG